MRDERGVREWYEMSVRDWGSTLVSWRTHVRRRKLLVLVPHCGRGHHVVLAHLDGAVEQLLRILVVARIVRRVDVDLEVAEGARFESGRAGLVLGDGGGAAEVVDLLGFGDHRDVERRLLRDDEGVGHGLVPAHADLARLNEHVDAVGILLHRAELADLLVHGHPQVAAGEEALGEVILEII